MKGIQTESYNEQLERIKTLKTLIAEKSKQIDYNKSYGLDDLISGSITKCPNQKLLNKIFAYQTQLDKLLEEINPQNS